MASDGAERMELPGEWAELELAVRRMLDEYDALRTRLARSEARCTELEASLRNYASGSVDPIGLQQRADALEAENRELRARLEHARDRVGRVMERLRFVEESR